MLNFFQNLHLKCFKNLINYIVKVINFLLNKDLILNQNTHLIYGNI